MKQEPPKVTAIYEAILTLLNRGQELYQLKVSDITKEAGIGKGTAYEYFSSKEKMLAGALVYDIKQLLQSLEGLQEKETQFERKLYVMLKWIGENIRESRTYARMVMVGNGTDPLSRSLQEEIFQMSADGCGYMAFLDCLICYGKQQGRIQEMETKEARIILVSQMLGLIMCTMRPELQKEISPQEAIEMTYRHTLKLLGIPFEEPAVLIREQECQMDEF